MESMDLKGIAWVGNIYQKFEALCLEVEDAMCKETAKYVENQVQTVGASMKRFCSDVMQDLLPPSSKDLPRAASADLLLNPYLEFGIHKKPILNIKEDNINPLGIKSISENKSNSRNEIWEDWSAASFNWEISDNDEANCDQIVIKASKEAKSVPKAGKKSKCISSNNMITAKHRVDGSVSAPYTDISESSGLGSQMGSHASSNTSSCQSIDGNLSPTDSCENRTCASLSQSDSHVSDNIHCGKSVGDEILRSYTGGLQDNDPDLEKEIENDTSIQMVETIGHEFESGFEETCVLVDGHDYSPDSCKEEIRRSYKKKIQNAFSLKKKSSRKQEYKQLAAQYVNANEEPTKISVSKNIKPKNFGTHASLESEWELL